MFKNWIKQFYQILRVDFDKSNQEIKICIKTELVFILYSWSIKFNNEYFPGYLKFVELEIYAGQEAISSFDVSKNLWNYVGKYDIPKTENPSVLNDSLIPPYLISLIDSRNKRYSKW